MITRVRKMEQYFDVVLEAVHTSPETIKQDTMIQEMIQELTEYMESGLWLHDYVCDSKGELPKDLKRGVLSEDGLYNLLCEIDEILLSGSIPKFY